MNTAVSFDKITEIATSITADNNKILENINNIVATTTNLGVSQIYLTDQASVEFITQVNTLSATFNQFIEDTVKYVQFLNTTVVTEYQQTEQQITGDANSLESVLPVAGAAAAVGGAGVTVDQLAQQAAVNDLVATAQTSQITTGGQRLSATPYAGTMTPEQMQVFYATIEGEAGNSFEDKLAVASVILNRADTGAWGGNNPASVCTAPGQFAAYLDKSPGYRRGLSNPSPDTILAAQMALNGTRNCTFTCFRASSNYKPGRVQLASGGNWYFS